MDMNLHNAFSDSGTDIMELCNALPDLDATEGIKLEMLPDFGNPLLASGPSGGSDCYGDLPSPELMHVSRLAATASVSPCLPAAAPAITSPPAAQRLALTPTRPHVTVAHPQRWQRRQLHARRTDAGLPSVATDVHPVLAGARRH